MPFRFVLFRFMLFGAVLCSAIPLRLLSIPERMPLVLNRCSFLPQSVFAVLVSRCIPLDKLSALIVVDNPQNNAYKHRKQTNSDVTKSRLGSQGLSSSRLQEAGR